MVKKNQQVDLIICKRLQFVVSIPTVYGLVQSTIEGQALVQGLGPHEPWGARDTYCEKEWGEPVLTNRTPSRLPARNYDYGRWGPEFKIWFTFPELQTGIQIGRLDLLQATDHYGHSSDETIFIHVINFNLCNLATGAHYLSFYYFNLIENLIPSLDSGSTLK